MFTGLVQDLGRVEGVERSDDGVRIRIATALASELARGDSIAVNGVCLTATEVGDGGFAHVWSELETAKRHFLPVTVTVTVCVVVSCVSVALIVSP